MGLQAWSRDNPGENSHYTHRGRLRFSWTKHPQIQREIVDKTLEEEHHRVFRQGKENYRGQQASYSREPDRTTRPDHSGMGTLSPARSEQKNLQESRSSHLLHAVALGKT